MGNSTFLPSRDLEHRVLDRIRNGDAVDDIADDLNLSPNRVRQVIRRANARYALLDEAYVDMERRDILRRNAEMRNAIYEMSIGRRERQVVTDAGVLNIKSPDLSMMRMVNDLDKVRREVLGVDKKQEVAPSAPVIRVEYADIQNNLLAVHQAPKQLVETKCLPPVNESQPSQ